MDKGPALTPDFNPGNAFWCTDHPVGQRDGRLECVKQRQAGRGRCHAPAVRGTDTCKRHGGARKEVVIARGQAAITAWQHMGDATKTVSPGLAVLSVLQMTWLRLASISQLLKQQVLEDAEEAAERRDLEDMLEDRPPSKTGGLVGHHYGAAGKDGHIFATGEEVRALVVLEAAERDRVVKYAKVAHDMGINDRLVNLAERWGDIVATRVTNILDGLDLTPEQAARVPVLVQSHLGTIDVDDAMDQT